MHVLLLGSYFFMVLSDFFEKDIPDCLLAPEVLGELSYRSINSKLPPRVAELRDLYPRAVSTLRFQHGWSTISDALVLFSDPDALDALWHLYLDRGRMGIAEFFGICPNTALSYVRYFGFHIRSAERLAYRRSLSCSFNPFLEESHLKYYLLGFILGDGCLVCKDNKLRKSIRVGSDYDVTHCTLELVLSSSDLDFISKFKSIFPICRFRGPIKGNYCLHITDRGVCEWLLRWGIVPGKSSVGVTLPEIPAEFIASFLLGLLDSDGWVTFNNNGKTLVMGWCGHISYMGDVLNMIQEFAPHAYLKQRADGLVLLYVGRQHEILRLAKAMYSNVPFCLTRKRDRIVQLYGQIF